MHAAVIGTGPAGTACVRALLRRGFRVTVMDAGETLESEKEAFAAELASLQPAEWGAERLVRAIDNPTIETHAIPRKLSFGSDYFYVLDRPQWPTDRGDTLAPSTFALGGFTVAWGGAVLAADDCDMADWPIKRAHLDASYERVLAQMPLSAQNDALEAHFPIYKRDPAPLAIPRQVAELQSDLARARNGSGLSPFIHGQARLAVRAQGDTNGPGCRYCGICLAGCPIGAIYTLQHEIPQLADRRALEYLSGYIVETVRERDRTVEIRAIELKTGEKRRLEFDRVFVGAGALNSTRIMMRSLALFDTPVRMKDSQKFIVPFLRLRASPIEWPAINTLAGLFIETKLERLSDHWVHIQISGLNDYVLRRSGANLVGRPNLRRRLLNPVLGRLMVAWCSLHSDHSSELELTLSRQTKDGSPILKVRNAIKRDTALVVGRVVRALTRKGFSFRSIFLPPLVQMSSPGAGVHSGGSFPMQKTASAGLWSDLFGRPMGAKRIHLIDASVFPSIPGTTILLPLMANADRIATDAPLDA